MNRWTLILATFLLGLLVATIPFGCAGDDDDDDDSAPSYGEEIDGTFSVEMMIDEDTCDENNIGFTEPWIVTIEQTADKAYATVYWSKEGPKSEAVELFKAKVYGYVVMLSEIQETPIGSSQCTKITSKQYRVKVDPDTGELTGRLADDIFYYGAGCDSSSRDCSQVRLLQPESE